MTTNMIGEDLDIIESLLLENGIKCEISRDGVIALLHDRDRVIVYSHDLPCQCMPDIGDPDFIKKLKNVLTICEKNIGCEDCPLNIW